MSKRRQQVTYDQQIYSDPNSLQGINYGTYQTTNYQNVQNTNNPQEILYQGQEQYIEEQPQYVIQGEAYDPQVQYIQEGEYVIQNDQNVQNIQNDQNYIYEYQQPETVITGYDQQQIYQQPPEQQQYIYQDENGQQYQEVYEQTPQIYQQEQRKAKFTKQIAQQKHNVKQKQVVYQPQENISRNPHIKQQYQYQHQNIPQQYIQNIPEQKYIPPPQPQPQPQPQVQIPKNMIKHDKPLIESDFEPEFQMANSVIGQSQIRFEQKQAPQSTNIYQNQQRRQQYVTPKRNPNANIKKYELTNSEHYVNTSDPGYRTNISKNINNTNNINQNQIQNQNQGVNITSKISKEQNISTKYSNNIGVEPNYQERQNQLLNQDEQPIVGEGISCLGNSSIMSNQNAKSNININDNNINIKNNVSNVGSIKNIINNSNINNSNMTNNSNINNNSINNYSKINNNSNIINNNNFDNNMTNSYKNINMNGNENNENNLENQMSQEEIDKENPIEEKVPDVSNMDNPKNIIEEDYEKYQPHYAAEEMHESKLKQSVDIDANMDHLPTFKSILQGKSEMLPPPKKRKYEQ